MKARSLAKGIVYLFSVVAIAGCSTTQKPPPATAVSESIMYYPNNDASSAQLSIEKIAQNDVLADKEFDYTIKVKNLTDCPLANIMLKEHLSENFQMTGSSPKGTLSADGRFAEWNISKLDGNAVQEILVRGKALQAQEFKNCATVTYEAYLCQKFNVYAPALVLTKTAQSEAFVDEAFPVRLVVKNSGTGVAKNIVITDPLPDGLVTSDGQKVLKFNVGDLGRNESKESAFTVLAKRSGIFTNVATATAEGLTAKANAITRVIQPQLQIVKTATESQYSGRNIEYTIKVTNVGSGNAVKTLVSDPIPQGASFVQASDGGALSGSQIVWNLGTLAPNASKTVKATVKAVSAGTILNTAYAQAERTAAVKSSAETKVSGVSALLLEVQDTVDPLEVGATGKYVITVSNQGTAKDSNIQIEIELESNMSYVTSSGPTQATVSGNKVVFAPLATLDAKAKASWTVNVRAEKAGDVRGTVRLNSSQLSRPVMETEATTIY